MMPSFIRQKMGGWGNKMLSKIKTVLLVFVVGFLLFATLYISFLLKSETESSPTTIKKTKAAAITYSKTIAYSSPTPIPTATIVPISPAAQGSFSAGGSMISPVLSPTSVLLAMGGAAVDTSPTPVSTLTPSPTSVLLAQAPTTSTISATIDLSTPTPTEVLLSRVTSTIAPTTAASVTATKTLPDAGWIRPAHLMFVFAFSLIIFSLIY